MDQIQEILDSESLLELHDRSDKTVHQDKYTGGINRKGNQGMNVKHMDAIREMHQSSGQYKAETKLESKNKGTYQCRCESKIIKKKHCWEMCLEKESFMTHDL